LRLVLWSVLAVVLAASVYAGIAADVWLARNPLANDMAVFSYWRDVLAMRALPGFQPRPEPERRP